MLVTGRKLPIGIQAFEDIRNDGYLYVDKTALMWTIANIGKPFFLSLGIKTIVTKLIE